MVFLSFFSSKTCGNNVHGNPSLAIRLPQKRSKKINRDVKYLRSKWHDKHIGAVKGV
jgi:hypothetical protein